MKKVLLISIMISISAFAYAQNNDVSQYANELSSEYPYRYNVSSCHFPLTFYSFGLKSSTCSPSGP